MADPGMPWPADFPERVRETGHGKVRAHDSARPPDLGENCGDGLGGLLCRITSCAEHDDRFTESVIEHGPGPAQPERYH